MKTILAAAFMLSGIALFGQADDAGELLGGLTKIAREKTGESEGDARTKAPSDGGKAASDDVRAKFSAKDLDALTSDILSKSRAEKYTARPQIPNFDFEENKVIEAYLGSIKDEKMHGREKVRVEYLATVRSGIIHTMARTPYTGAVKLKSGSVKGPVANANENGFFIVRGTKKKPKAKTYKWSEASPELIVLMMEQYTSMRERLAPAKDMPGAEIKEETSKQYLALAIFCDWYGMYDKAVKYARKAVQTDPARTRTAEILFLD